MSTELLTGRSVISDSTGVEYRVGRMLGAGGFGLAHQASRYGNPDDEVCLKVIQDDQASWHREAYFGELLRGVDRAIQVYDSFVLIDRPNGSRRIRYCLALELAEQGSLADHLDDGGEPWAEAAATKEVIGLLKVLDHLHRGGALHRDLTPMNVFVCEGRRLKLGDFGIARHARGGRGLPADAFNSWFASKGLQHDERRRWEGADDTYQMAQLIGVLLTGDIEHRITGSTVRDLPCGARLQAVIANAIGTSRHRYRSAFEMLEGLRRDADPPPADEPASLAEKVVLFTGRMTMPRNQATKLARLAGASVTSSMSPRVDVVVRGKATATFMTKDAGRKLLAAERLKDRGDDLVVIDEVTFRRLVDAL